MAYAPRNYDPQESRSTYPTVSQLARPAPTDDRYKFQSGPRYVPTADIYVDPTRRPEHGNARTCVMEVNISVTLGDRNRPPTITTTSSSQHGQPPVIRSRAMLEDVHYVDLNFPSSGNVAHLSTDGIIKHSPPSFANGK